MRPNLFYFATSELSQDAVLCWLLSWADSTHQIASPELNKVGKDFLACIYQQAKRALPTEINSVKVSKQDGHIDILCIVNGDTAILIEDKVATQESRHQLAKYRAHLKSRFTDEKVIPVYIQTGDQSDYSRVVENGYLVLNRSHLLAIFESSTGKAACKKSDILEDFRTRLCFIERDVQSYLTVPSKEWGKNAWKGFYSRLQTELGVGKWSNVPTPSGGFVGYWWHFQSHSEVKIYLQLEEKKFCFKLSVSDVKQAGILRQHWYKQVVSKAFNHGIKVVRPARFGSGKTMTVATLCHDFPIVDKNGLLDINESLKVIAAAQSLLDDCFSIERTMHRDQDVSLPKLTAYQDMPNNHC